MDGLDAELEAIGDVYGVNVSTLFTSQGRKSFDAQLREIGSSGPAVASFYWEIGSRNLLTIARARLGSTIQETCTETSLVDMLMLFRWWLAEQHEALLFLQPESGSVPDEVIAKTIGPGKVLCVYEEGRTSIVAALKRSGFGEKVIEACFKDLPIAPGRHSNLMESLEAEADEDRYLLYAWDGLRHTSSAVESKFGRRLHKARTASKVVSLFKASFNRSA